MILLEIIHNALVQVDPDNQYDLAPEQVNQFVTDTMGELLPWFQAMDLTTQTLDQVWEEYTFGDPSTDPRVQILKGKYHYPSDPVLSPMVTVTTSMKGYLEEFHIYPYAMVAYLKDHVLVSHGRMD